MSKLYLLSMLLTAPVIGNSQSFTLPTVYIDSLLFEVAKYRVCDSVLHAQADEIMKLGLELMANAVALRLSESKSKTLESLVSNVRESQNLDLQQYALDKAKLKRKIRKRNLLIVVETIGLVGLILLL